MAASASSVSTIALEPELPTVPVANSPWGFTAGLVVGVLLTLAALGIGSPEPLLATGETGATGATESGPQGLLSWIGLNLGHSVWFFALVFALYVMNLQQLNRLLKVQPQSSRVTELDQLSDVWMHLFVGIGVIWTAVGMRSALQAALGDADGLLLGSGVGSPAVDSADNVLRKLVDGGILLALTTTIVGGVGGYLMRLVKTVLVGTRLQELFERQERSDVQALVAATERIELHLTAGHTNGSTLNSNLEERYAPAH